MPIASALKKFFNVPITIEPWLSEDSFNKPVYGPAVSYKGKVEKAQFIIRGDFGSEQKSTRLIYILTTDAIDARSRITLPADLSPINPKILSVRAVYDVPGRHHIVIETE